MKSNCCACGELIGNLGVYAIVRPVYCEACWKKVFWKLKEYFGDDYPAASSMYIIKLGLHPEELTEERIDNELALRALT